MGVIRKDLPVFVSTWGINQNEFGITVFEQPRTPDETPPEVVRVIMTPDEMIHLANELIDVANQKIQGERYTIDSIPRHPDLGDDFNQISLGTHRRETPIRESDAEAGHSLV